MSIAIFNRAHQELKWFWKESGPEKAKTGRLEYIIYVPALFKLQLHAHYLKLFPLWDTFMCKWLCLQFGSADFLKPIRCPALLPSVEGLRQIMSTSPHLHPFATIKG